MISGQHCTVKLGLAEIKRSKGRKCQDTEEGGSEKTQIYKTKTGKQEGEKPNATKAWLSRKVSKMDRALSKLTRKQGRGNKS